MPQFSLSPAEIEAVQTAILGMQKDDMADALVVKAAGSRGAVEAGRRIVKDYNCQGCHILEDKGGGIREAMTANKIDLALAPPIIRGEGAKVQSDWLFSFLHAPRSGQIRPWLKVRMPTFEFNPDQLNSSHVVLRVPRQGALSLREPRRGARRALARGGREDVRGAQVRPVPSDVAGRLPARAQGGQDAGGPRAHSRGGAHAPAVRVDRGLDQAARGVDAGHAHAHELPEDGRGAGQAREAHLAARAGARHARVRGAQEGSRRDLGLRGRRRRPTSAIPTASRRPCATTSGRSATTS